VVSGVASFAPGSYVDCFFRDQPWKIGCHFCRASVLLCVARTQCSRRLRASHLPEGG
jgi:hypothetical protein